MQNKQTKQLNGHKRPSLISIFSLFFASANLVLFIVALSLFLSFAVWRNGDFSFAVIVLALLVLAIVFGILAISFSSTSLALYLKYSKDYHRSTFILSIISLSLGFLLTNASIVLHFFNGLTMVPAI